MMRSTQLIIILIASIFIQGCWSVASSGAQAVYNRHQLQNNLKDQYLTLQAYQKLYMKTKEFNDTNIAISTYNKEMLLAGQVPQAAQKTKVETLLKEIPDIEHIYNLLEVKSPSSTLTRVSDTWITTKIKSKLMASNDVDATQVKVVTENGTVYLMGVLLPEQANAAVDVASNTDGVRSVVKIYSYMKISKKLVS